MSEQHTGMTQTSDTKEKIKQIRTGTKATEEAKKNMSIAGIGRKNTIESRKNMRIATIKRIETQIGEGGQMYPRYNSKACKFFKWLDKNILGVEGRHGTNGDEFKIEEVGYWPDYINHELKLIIEWDEEKHYKNDELSDKDKTRQKEIESIFPDYDFIRIRESQLNYFMLCLLVGMRYKKQLKG